MKKILVIDLVALVFVIGCMTSGMSSVVPTAEAPREATAIWREVTRRAPAVAVSAYDAGDVPGYWVPAWYVVCAAETLNVRGGPEDGATWLDVLPNGERVWVREWSHNGNGWAMISDQPGGWPYSPQWVNGDYLCREVE